jgi:hypothetical protein
VIERSTAGHPESISMTDGPESSTKTSIPEVLGNAGLLFDPASPLAIADALEKVWCNASLRQKMVVLGKQRAKSFSSARVAEGHLAVFAQARETYSHAQFWKRRWILRPYHRACVEWHWRGRKGN